jgi:peptide/nickel transport system ATP-binding protein
MSQNVVEIRDLRTHFYVRKKVVKAVDGVDLDINTGVKLGLVGESGSGKSTMALSIMRMHRPPTKITGSIVVDGVDLLKLSEEEMRRTRLSQIAMIPQGAMNCLNPVMRVEDQVIDGLNDHGLSLSKTEMKKKVVQLLETVELPAKVARMYPHELSGGMKQRVTVAIAISMMPKLLIADEPTSALDVVIQRQVMETITRLATDLGLSMILIGHDMGLMAQSVDRLAVMYAGKVMEIGNVRDMFSHPLHPYTQALIQSLPVLGNRGVFKGIPGIPPSATNPPPGCPFHARCSQAIEGVCNVKTPVLRELRPGQMASCHLYEGTN